MSSEEFKLIVEALKGLADGTITAVITYMILYFLVPVVKYSVVCFTVYKCISKVFDKILIKKVE